METHCFSGSGGAYTDVRSWFRFRDMIFSVFIDRKTSPLLAALAWGGGEPTCTILPQMFLTSVFPIAPSGKPLTDLRPVQAVDIIAF